MAAPKLKPIDYFAFQIFLKLMDRHNLEGYVEIDAIDEAYRLGNLFLNYKLSNKPCSRPKDAAAD